MRVSLTMLMKTRVKKNRVRECLTMFMETHDLSVFLTMLMKINYLSFFDEPEGISA